MHISDLHFQAGSSLNPFGGLDWRQLYALAEFRWQGRPALFAQAAATVARLLSIADAEQVDQIVVSGDLTAVSAAGEFAAALRALKPAEPRLTLVPGNHDRTSQRSYRDFEALFADHLRSDLPDFAVERSFPLVRLVGTDGAVVGLNSARVPPLPGLAPGRIGDPQLAALEKLLGDARLRGRGVVVAVHHAPFQPNGKPDTPDHGLVDANELLPILDRFRVAALCHGHIHQRYATARPGKTPVFGAGSSTQRGREGYVLLEVSPAGVTRAQLVSLDPAPSFSPGTLAAARATSAAT